MTIAQRKIALISWISNLTSERKLTQLEDLRGESESFTFPSELMELLSVADQESTEGLRLHTSFRDI